MEMAVESGVIVDKTTEHLGWPTLGFMQKPGENGGLVVNTGCTDWACGLKRDLVVLKITMNALRKLSGNESLGAQQQGAGSAL